MNNKNAIGRRARLAPAAAGLVLALSLGGCATGPNANPSDPLEPLNRNVSKFNEGVDAVLLKPTATLYREAVPPLLRTGVSNFFGNLGDAWSTINNLLQFKIQYAAESLMRFSVNTTIGMGGFLDVASDMNLERHKEDFGQTLGRWGVPAGPYIVLPLLGPSTLRDTAALPVDWNGDIVTHVNPDSARNGLIGLRVVDVRSNLLRAGDVLEGAALDKYSFTRDAYLQRRRSQIFDSSRGDNPSDGSDGRDGRDGSDGSDGSDG
ncbi:MAG: VacJ family lipoprotein, partial [Comamonadaceae bacterium]